MPRLAKSTTNYFKVAVVTAYTYASKMVTFPSSITKPSASGALRATAGLLALASMLVVLLATSGTAKATDFPWGCLNVAPNGWCYNPYTHTYGYNSASRVPQATVNLCAKLVKPSDHNFNYARKCQLSTSVYVYSNGGGLAPYPNNSVSMDAAIANGNNCCTYDLAALSQY